MLREISLVFITLASGGCVPYFSPTDKHNPGDAYLYGRFAVDARGEDGLDGGMRMGFIIVCRDGSQYNIHFAMATPLEVVKIAPSRCWIVEPAVTG